MKTRLVFLLALAPLLIQCGSTTKEVEVCPDEQEDCDGLCATLATDTQNCGACGNACGAGETCEDGECAAAGGCGDLDECDGACVDTDFDPGHCGDCATACTAGQFCDDGTCADTTGGGCGALETCEGLCTDTQHDPGHCGDCGTACEAGEVCDAGDCVASAGCGALAQCGGACVDTDVDGGNCGDCGVTCDPGEVCAGGACTVSCGAGLSVCTGACVDLDNDPLNCGGCGVGCNPGEGCLARVCTGVAGPSTHPNGVGGTYTTSSTDEETNSRLACESVHGAGNCDNVACGSCNDRGYHLSGAPDCNGSVYWNYVDEDQAMSCGWVDFDEIMVSYNGLDWQNGTSYPNGVGGTYETTSSDERTNARLACESVHGGGNCDTNGCGSCNDRGFHEIGAPNCNGSVYWNFLDSDQAMSCGWVDANEIIVSADGTTWTQ